MYKSWKISLRAMGVLFSIFICFFISHTALWANKPNIVHVFIDDADMTILNDEMIENHFPNINRLFREGGTTFENYSSSTPLCGPVRASLFRWQLGHNTGIRTNFYVEEHWLVSTEEKLNGSWQLYHDYGYVNDDIGVWMKNAGYKTMLVGKYHHENFPKAAAEKWKYIPPGWDEFYVSMWGKYYETRRLINGKLDILDSYPNQYRTDVEKEDILNLLDVHNQESSDQPFYLYFAPFAPHARQAGSNDPIYAVRHANEFNDFTLDNDLRFNEWNVSDKAQQIASLDQLSTTLINGRNIFYRDRLRSMLAVDEAIWEIYQKIDDMWEADNTYIFLSSDNGLQLWHHRVLWSKKFPYKLSTTMPMYVSGPGVEAWKNKTHLTSNIDLAPTFVDIAQGSTKHFWDGQSLLPVLEWWIDNPNNYRTALLVENWEWISSIDANHKSIKFENASYNVWKNGSKEYFDHRYDPYETENIYNKLSQVQKNYLDSVHDNLAECIWINCIYKDDDFINIMGEHYDKKPTSSISFIHHNNYKEWGKWEWYELQWEWEIIEWNSFDQEGIEKVEIVIWKIVKNNANNYEKRYYNFDTQKFQSTRKTNNTELFEKNADETHVRWRFEMPRLESLEGKGIYWLVVRARDKAGNWEYTVPRLLLKSNLAWSKISANSPLVYIKSWEGTSPLNEDIEPDSSWDIIFRWEASSPNSIKQVQVVIRKTGGWDWWNPDLNIWQSTPISDTAVLSNVNSEQTDWSYTLDADLDLSQAGQYLFIFRYVDGQNNIWENHSFRFSVK